MIELNLDDVFKNLDVQKASSKKRKRSKNKVPPEAIQLGNESALSHLPNEVNDEFLRLYNETIDDMLYPYVAHGVVSISHASKYGQTIVENVFGNDSHLGIYHYLKDKNANNLSDKKLVSQAEKLLMQGWHIKSETGRFWLYNPSLERVLDMGGSSKESIYADAQSFGPENSHLFFDEITASKIYALAKHFGYDADELSKYNNLNVLLTKTENLKLKGYLTNYARMQVLLEKNHTYRTLTQGTSLFDLYEKNYRFSDKIVPKGIILSNDDNDLIVFPTEGKMGESFSFHKGMMGFVAHQLRKEIYKNFKKINFQNIIPLKDMRYVFGFASDFFESSMVQRSYFESVNVLEKINKDEIMKDLSTLIVTESILLGNEWFNPTSFGFDSASNEFFVYFTKDSFTRKNLDTLVNPASKEVFSYSLNALDFVDYLPSSYKDVIKDLEIDSSDFDVEMNSIKQYFEEAKEFILKEI